MEHEQDNSIPACFDPKSKPLWKIVDRKTGLQVGGTYTNRRRASRRVDQLDNEYGAYRYDVRPVN